MGEIVPPIKMVLLGSKLPKLKHILGHQRQLLMIPNNADSTFRIEGLNYVAFVTSETMKCFDYGTEGHLIRVGARRENTLSK